MVRRRASDIPVSFPAGRADHRLGDSPARKVALDAVAAVRFRLTGRRVLRRPSSPLLQRGRKGGAVAPPIRVSGLDAEEAEDLAGALGARGLVGSPVSHGSPLERRDSRCSRGDRAPLGRRHGGTRDVACRAWTRQAHRARRLRSPYRRGCTEARRVAPSTGSCGRPTARRRSTSDSSRRICR